MGSYTNKYEVSTLKIMQDSMNTRDLDKKFVQTPRTQPGYVGKFSIFIVVLIFLFTFQNVNNKIKTTTENLPTQAGCVPGIPTDFLSESLVFVESCTILRVDTSYLPPPLHNLSRLPLLFPPPPLAHDYSNKLKTNILKMTGIITYFMRF